MFKSKARAARIAVLSIVALAVLLGAIYKGGWGTLCSFGPASFSFVCPLGFLQMVVAGKAPLPPLWLPLGATLLAVLLLGRVFCGWICPMALLAELFGRRRAGLTNHSPAAKAADALAGGQAPADRPAGVGSKRALWGWLPRYGVLGGALLSSLLFGFPVFCLVCPVGLFFGSLFAISRLFTTQQPSWELLVFPALLGIELLVLKSWCSSICPLGALLSLLSGLNRTLRPHVDKAACLVSRGVNCQACRKACPEGIDLVRPENSAPLRDCTKCLECSERCPANAIRFPLLRR